MTTQKEVTKIENAIKQLRMLKSDLIKREKLANAMFQAKGSAPKKVTLAGKALGKQCTRLAMQRTETWTAILDAGLEVNIDKE